MRDKQDIWELRKAAARLGLGSDFRAAKIMAAVVGDSDDMNPYARRMFVRGLVIMYRRAGTLGQYLEHVPKSGTVWERFHTLISESAMEMARKRRGDGQC